MADIQISLSIPGTANTQTVAVTTTSTAMATAFTYDGYAIVYVSADMYAVQNTNPTATTAGMRLVAGSQYRVPVKNGHKIAFICSSGTGTAEVTPQE